MQEFGSKIGWARNGLFASAALLVVMGVLCFVAHSIMPEALHNPQLPEGYTWPLGEIILAVVMAVTGICQISAWKMAGGTRILSGWLVLSGVMSIVWCLACVVDPFVGTFSFEWVDAVFIAFAGLAVILGSVAGGRIIGYKAWLIEAALGAVMVVLGLGVVFNSAYADTMLGLSMFVYAVINAMVPVMGKDMKLAE